MRFLYLNSDAIGAGDAELGRKLLRNFLAELANAGETIDVIGCVNAGVHLTTEGSEALESLRKLETLGARIASCGTCLDHFGIRERLAIGSAGNMAGTVQLMLTATQVIRPC